MTIWMWLYSGRSSKRLHVFQVEALRLAHTQRLAWLGERTACSQYSATHIGMRKNARMIHLG
jgi:hypothetical protein